MTNPLIPGWRNAVRLPGPPEAPHRTQPLPGAQMTKDELHAELRRHGFTGQHIKLLENHRPAHYDGHRKCVGCGAYHPNQGGMIDHCTVCGWCRHATHVSGVCADCGLKDPPFVELGREHFDVHWLDENGVVERVERG